MIPQQDGLMSLTRQYKPTEWHLFDFFISPFNPIYTTEVSIKDSSFIDILISKKQKDNSYIVVKSDLTNFSSIHHPGIYMLCWAGITDNYKLPVVDGEYKIVLKAYGDTKRNNLLFSDSTTTITFFGWEDFDKALLNKFLLPLPEYIVLMGKSLSKRSKNINRGLEWEFSGIRVRRENINQLTPSKISLSFKFKLNDKSHAFSYFYAAKQNPDGSPPFLVQRQITRSESEIVEFKINYGEFDYLIIDSLGGDLSILDLKLLWQYFSKTK